MDSSRRSSESFSLFPRDIRGFALGRSSKARSSTSSDGQARPTPVQSSKLPRTPVLSRLPASIQHLPPEIVLNILGFALPSLYDKALNFRHDSNPFFDAVEVQPDFRRVLKETQACLLRSALVCRAWYPVAVEFLYGCPFLHCSASAVTLSRTLQNTPRLRHLLKEVWLFNEEGAAKLSDPLGTKRKTARRVQADLTRTLRKYTILDSVIVCNFGLLGQNDGQEFYPIDNLMVYGLPVRPEADTAIPRLTLYGPSFFNLPWTRHAKPNNLDPERLTRLCMRDIPPSPAALKCAPYIPTLPQVHTLQFALVRHSCAPIVSSGTLPVLRNLEVYRDIYDDAPAEGMRAVVVEEAVIPKLERLHIIGRAMESVQFRIWAEGQLFGSMRHLAIGPLRPDDLEFLSDWKFPDRLETLVVVVWHRRREGGKRARRQAEDEEDIKNVFRAILACVHRNRQARSFKKLSIRAVTPLPRCVQGFVDELERKCASHQWQIAVHEGG